MDHRIIELYDEYTHRPLERRTFLERLAVLAGSSAAAYAMLPLLEANYARAALVDPADPRLATSTIGYPGASGEVLAYLALPKEGAPKRAGVIVIHENRGLNPYIKDVARRVALEGFTALAPDALSPFGGTPSDEDQARAAFGRLDRDATVRSFVAAIAYLKSRPDAAGPVGAVGFCWGGGMVNLLAVAAPDLTAAVPFYGLIAPSGDVPRIKARLQLHYAGYDPRINAGVPEFETALKRAGVAYEKHVYEGTDHAFHNDTGAARYNKAAAELAWSRTIAFFKANLR
ncbi:MAG TPA: dienelactone hydrolase family protein [Burkholderiales bacterium]|jgi:carboxymethylenebutenolidase|nr:dienelactone hydrolase family protein [Burkholderiales bacterium]